MAALVTTADVIARWPEFAGLAAAQQTALIDDASSAVVSYCGRHFESTEYEEVLSGRNLERVWLGHTPVLSIESIVVDNVTLGPTTYRFVSPTGELLRLDCGYWPWGTANIVAAYTAGYTAIPAGVVRATVLAMQSLHTAAGTSGGLMAAERIGDYSYTIGSGGVDIPPLARWLLRPYVRHDPVV